VQPIAMDRDVAPIGKRCIGPRASRRPPWWCARLNEVDDLEDEVGAGGVRDAPHTGAAA